MSLIVYTLPYTRQPAFTASKKRQEMARNSEKIWKLSEDSRLEREENQVDT